MDGHRETVTYRCSHCGSEWEISVKLRKGPAGPVRPMQGSRYVTRGD